MLTPGGVTSRGTSVHVLMKLEASAHPYASFAQSSEVRKSPSVDVPHFEALNCISNRRNGAHPRKGSSLRRRVAQMIHKAGHKLVLSHEPRPNSRGAVRRPA